MNTPEHQAIVRLAFACLKSRADRPVCALAPGVRNACMLPDEVALPLLRGERGRWRPYFPAVLPRFNFEHDQRDFRAMLPANRFYLERILASLRHGRQAEAARFLGVYSHYLGDFSQPAHHYELEIGGLLPPPAAKRNCNYHRMLEDVPSSVAMLRHRPRLLGTSVPEVLFRLEGAYAALFRRSVAAVIPMTRAVYADRLDRATAALDPVLRATAALFADFCHTVAALVQRRFTAADLRVLGTCDLRVIEPHVWDAEYNFGQRPLVDVICLRQYGPAEALAVYQRRGRQRVAVTIPGVCLIPHALPMPGVKMQSALEYRLPPGVFRRFTATVGLLATDRPQAPCVFVVEVDGRAVYRSGWQRPGDLAVAVDVRLGRARRLRLLVRTDGSTDRLAYPVWGNPRLAKA